MREIEKLFLIRNSYGENALKEKITVLQTLSERENFTARKLSAYYNTLQFLLAYPDNNQIASIVSLELIRIGQLIKSQSKIAERLKETGLPNTRVTGVFSYYLIKWLRDHYKNNINLIEISATKDEILSILQLIANPVSYEILLEGHIHSDKWIRSFGNHTLLDTWLYIFEASTVNEKLKEDCWNRLSLIVEISFTAGITTRLDISVAKKYSYCSGLNKIFDITLVLKQKSKEIRLDKDEKKRLISVSRFVLASHQRETDPVTYCRNEDVKCFQMPGGLTVALFTLPAGLRQPLDSYIGYLAYKNGIPVAYGGGWILFDSCRIGVNIFPALRGGESSYIFSQLLSLYKNIFSLKRFTVDPYQVGKNNSEGIRSGAFWMYYRLGFIPVETVPASIASDEFKKLNSNKNYRTSPKILKTLAESRLAYFLPGMTDAVLFDATDLSILYRNIVGRNFNGDLKSAEDKSYQICLKILKPVSQAEKDLLRKWAVLLYPGIEKFKSLPGILKELLSLKVQGNEWEYVHKLNACKLLKAHFNELVIKYGSSS